MMTWVQYSCWDKTKWHYGLVLSLLLNWTTTDIKTTNAKIYGHVR